MKKKYVFKIYCFVIVLLVLPCLFCSSNSKVTTVIKKFNGGPVVPRNANSIFIHSIKNRTANIQLDEVLKQKLVKEINLDGRLAVISEYSNADLLMYSSIQKYSIEQLTHDAIGRVDKKRIKIRFMITLQNRKNKKFIFKNEYINSYYNFSEISPPIMSEYFASDTLLQSLAEKAAKKIITGWYTQLMSSMEKGSRMEEVPND